MTTIFVHVPKTAGVSLARIIEHEYGRDAVWRMYGYQRADDLARFLDLPDDEVAKIRAVIGHMEFGFHRLLDGPARYVTILRDPIDRVVSHYHYVRHVAQDQRPRRALEGVDSLEAYVTRSPQASQFNNGQVRQLGGDLHVPGRPATRAMLDRAKRNLEQFAVVGLQEHFDESVLLMREALGWGWPVLARHNLTPNRPGVDAVDPHVRELIAQHNDLDMELYEFGKACFERQLAAYGSSLDDDLDTLRRVHPTESQDGPSLSAVVMGYRNEATIVAAVRSVLDQVVEDWVEVIAVVSGDDGSAALLRELGDRVQVVESPTRLLPGGTRNAGIAECRGEVVAFLAGDCVATPMWAAQRIASHQAGHDVVAGAVDVAKGAGTLARAELYLLYSARLAGHPAGPASHPQAHGLSFSRWALDRMDPFRDDVRIGEDTLMLEPLERLGIPVWFEPSIVIEHARPTSFVAFLRDQHARERRESQWDVMQGGFPQRWFDSIPWLAVALRGSKRLIARMRQTFPGAWRASRGHRWRVVAALPAMFVGTLARQWGWMAEQRRSLRQPSAG